MKFCGAHLSISIMNGLDFFLMVCSEMSPINFLFLRILQSVTRSELYYYSDGHHFLDHLLTGASDTSLQFLPTRSSVRTPSVKLSSIYVRKESITLYTLTHPHSHPHTHTHTHTPTPHSHPPLTHTHTPTHTHLNGLKERCTHNHIKGTALFPG